MRAPHLFVITILFLALGGWLYLSQGGEAGGPDALGGPATSVAPVSPAKPNVALEAPEAAGETAAPERERIETLVEEPVVASAEVERPARIRGRAIDPDGRPIADADVRVRRARGMGMILTDRGPAGPDEQERAARTDRDGRFDVSVDFPGSLEVRLLADGFAPFVRRTKVAEGTDSDLGDLALEPGIQLAGQVLDHLGRPLPGARVHRAHEVATDSGLVILRPGSAGEFVTETDEDGRFDVRQHKTGAWKLTVTHEEHPPATIEGTLENAGDRDETLLVQMDEGFEIRGRVTGAPKLDDLVVRVTDARGDSPLAGFGPGGPAGAVRRNAAISGDGTFRVAGLSRDQRYRLRLQQEEAAPWGMPSSRSETVDAAAGETGVVLEYSLGASLVFQVVDDKTGEPLREFEVEAGLEWPMPVMAEAGGVRRLFEEGQVRVDGLRPKHEDDRAQLAIRAVGYETFSRKDIALVANQENDLGTIRLKTMPTVRVTVIDDESGEPIGNARVTMREAPEQGDGFQVRRSISIGASAGGDEELELPMEDGASSGRTDAAGVAILSSMPGKEVEIEVWHKDYARNASGRISLPMVGEHAVEIALNLGGRVAVTVVDEFGEPLAGQPVERRDPPTDSGVQMLNFGGPGPRETDAEGRAVFDKLEDGLHGFRLGEKGPAAGGMMVFDSIQIAGGEVDESWTEVQVVPGETIELTLVAPSRAELVGVVTEAGEPLVDAQVRLEERGKAATMPGMSFLGGGGPVARTDAKGRFVFEDVKAADYELTIEHSTRRMPAVYDVEVLGGANDFDVDLPVTILEGRITDEEGNPVAGLRVVPENVQSGGGRTQMRMVMVTADSDGAETIISDGAQPRTEARTDADGFFSLRGVQPDVDLVVKASGGDWEPMQSKTVNVPAGAVETGVDLVAKQAGAMLVKLLRADGSPASSMLLNASYKGEDADGVEPKFEFVGESGEALFRGLKPGKWEIVVRGMSSPDEVLRHEQEVVATETAEVPLTLP